jgi:hypothetical protein
VETPRDPSFEKVRSAAARARTLREIIGYWLPEDTRLGLLREAGLADIHPPILREVVLLSPRRTLKRVMHHRVDLAPLVSQLVSQLVS